MRPASKRWTYGISVVVGIGLGVFLARMEVGSVVGLRGTILYAWWIIMCVIGAAMAASRLVDASGKKHILVESEVRGRAIYLTQLVELVRLERANAHDQIAERTDHAVSTALETAQGLLRSWREPQHISTGRMRYLGDQMRECSDMLEQTRTWIAVELVINQGESQ